MTPRSRAAAAFLLQSVAFASWLPRIPDVQARLGIGPETLALALAGMPIGTLMVLAPGNALVTRAGAAAVTRLGALLLAVALPTAATADTTFRLGAALALAGAAMTAVLLGPNVIAARIERDDDVPFLNACHGWAALGALIGGALGTGLTAAGISPGAAVGSVALGSLPLVAVLVPGIAESEAHAVSRPSRRLRLPGRALTGVALFAFGVALVEGAVADWSAVFLRERFAASAALSGVGYTLFAAAIVVGRFAGDRLVLAMGAVSTARAAVSVAVAGALAVVLGSEPAAVLAGFAGIGLGTSVGYPLALSAAARSVDGPSASNVATMTFIALTGFLVGPLVIGVLAERVGLRGALIVLPAALLTSLVLARHLDPGPGAHVAPSLSE